MSLRNCTSCSSTFFPQGSILAYFGCSFSFRALGIQFSKKCILKDLCSLADKMGKKWSLCHWAWLVLTQWGGTGGDMLLSWMTAWQLGQQSVEFCMWTGRPSLFIPTPRHNLWNADLTGRAGISAPSLPGTVPVRARAACRDKPCFANRAMESGSAVTLLAAGEGAELAGTQPWGFTGGKGGCGLHRLHFNIGTKIRNSVHKNTRKHGINILTVY